MAPEPPNWAQTRPDGGWDLRIKVVPGAKTERVAGPLGDALKVAVRAPPEGGKANAAVLALLATYLGLKRHDLAISAGHSQARKVVTCTGEPRWP
ncbi:MAG: DUF167 domain-containing protein [Planctomycetota bacterium]|nr:DUF167 domain-containing protein [Planctomycetota bacterium]